MSRASLWGIACGLIIFMPLFIPALLRCFSKDRYAERWGRFEYRISRSGSFVFEGQSFRKENPENLDEVASRLLAEFFEVEKCDHHERYHCVAFLKGYGAGEAWGR